jgi:hypothetical protein
MMILRSMWYVFPNAHRADACSTVMKLFGSQADTCIMPHEQAESQACDYSIDDLCPRGRD